MDISVK